MVSHIENGETNCFKHKNYNYKKIKEYKSLSEMLKSLKCDKNRYCFRTGYCAEKNNSIISNYNLIQILERRGTNQQ